MSDPAYPELGPLGWPLCLSDFEAETYIDLLRAEGREDEVPCMKCGHVGKHECLIIEELARFVMGRIPEDPSSDESHADFLIRLLDELRAEAWIPVSERLPEEGRDYRAWTGGVHAGIPIEIDARWKGGDRGWIAFYEEDEMIVPFITHWRPLAKGPMVRAILDG